MNRLMRSFAHAVHKRKRSARNWALSSGAQRKKISFRDLRAFGMWRNRADLKDPVQFTNELRARVERPLDAR